MRTLTKVLAICGVVGVCRVGLFFWEHAQRVELMNGVPSGISVYECIMDPRLGVTSGSFCTKVAGGSTTLEVSGKAVHLGVTGSVCMRFYNDMLFEADFVPKSVPADMYGELLDKSGIFEAKESVREKGKVTILRMSLKSGGGVVWFDNRLQSQIPRDSL